MKINFLKFILSLMYIIANIGNDISTGIKKTGKQTLPNNFTKFSSPQNGDASRHFICAKTRFLGTASNLCVSGWGSFLQGFKLLNIIPSFG